MKRKAFDDPDLTLDGLMALWPETIAVFLRYKMLCVGCQIGPFHTVEDACREYSLNMDAFLQELEQAISGAAAPR